MNSDNKYIIFYGQFMKNRIPKKIGLELQLTTQSSNAVFRFPAILYSKMAVVTSICSPDKI